MGHTRSSGSVGSLNRKQRYERVQETIDAVLAGETDPLVWMATVTAILKQEMKFLWVGFYLTYGEELLVGPYQGEPACLRIPFSRGVCGAAARTRRTVVVPDVHQFEGHITCDSRAQSEIVVPLLDGQGQLRGVLDVDSESLATFDETDRQHLEALLLGAQELKWPLPS